MDNELSRRVDLVKASLSQLLALSFAKSSSQSYALAVHAAKQAVFYNEEKVGAHTIHYVVFEKTREDAARAVSLLQYVGGWKSTQIYGGGKLLQDRYKIAQILRCYLEAAACDDHKAHCYTVIDDPFRQIVETTGVGISLSFSPSGIRTTKEIQIDEYVFPCAYLVSYFRRKNDKHPSDPVNQIQATAIAVGCDLCPYFDAKEYKLVGQRTKILYGDT